MGWKRCLISTHHNDITMSTMASQITSLTIVYSIVYSDADYRKYQSSASLAFVRGIQRGPVNSPHKWPVTRKMFLFDDVIMVLLNTTKFETNTLVHHMVFDYSQCHTHAGKSGGLPSRFDVFNPKWCFSIFCNHLSMLGLELIHVSKRGPVYSRPMLICQKLCLWYHSIWVESWLFFTRLFRWYIGKCMVNPEI